MEKEAFGFSGHHGVVPSFIQEKLTAVRFCCRTHCCLRAAVRLSGIIFGQIDSSQTGWKSRVITSILLEYGFG